MNQIYSLTEAKSKFSEIINRVLFRKEKFTITELEKRGIGCSEPDLRIAAVAIQHSLILITGNIRHFENIPGLRVEDWTAWKNF